MTLMTKRNIAIFIDSLGGGGAEKVMITLARQMQHQGHYVHFFILEPRIEYTDKSLNYSVLYKATCHRKSTSTGRLKQTARDMQQLVLQTEKNVGKFNLHLANLDPSCQVANLCSFKNIYYVLHNAMAQEIKREGKLGPLKLFRKLKQKKAYNNKNIIAVSEGVAQEALSGKLIKPASVTTIYNPINKAEIVTASEATNPGIPNEPYLIHAGRVVKQKRHDILFKALKLVPDIKLVLLCKNIPKALKLAKRYGVADRIVTPQFQDNPYVWIKNAKALVSSSDFEGLGMNLIDSLICGTPVVSTDCDFGPNEILTGNLADFLVPTGDHKALADKINQVLKSPPTIDINGVSEKFGLEQATQKYLELIK